MSLNSIKINTNDTSYTHSIFNISEYTGRQYDDLSSVLADVPTEKQSGGMTIRYIQTSDNKYVQWRLMANTFSTTVSDWQGVDDKPMDGSDNLVKSGGVASALNTVLSNTEILAGGTKHSSNIESLLTFNNNYAIHRDGTIASAAEWEYSSPYLLLRGHKVTIECQSWSYPSIGLATNPTIQVGDKVTVVGEIGDFKKTYTADRDIYVVFSFETLISIVEEYYTYDFEEKANKESVDLLNKKVNILGELSEKHSIQVSFSNDGYIKTNGTISQSAGKHTDKILLNNFIEKIKYKFGLDSTGYGVAFYDDNNSLIPEISISGNNPYSVEEGEVLVTSQLLESAKYVAFSYYDGEHYGVLVPYNSIEDTVNTIIENTAEIHSPLFHKHFCCLGDSLSDGDGNGFVSWYDMLLEIYDATNISLNFANSGQCLRTMADRCTLANMANIDFLFVMGGTNQLSNYRLGTINDDATPDRWEPNKSYNVGDKCLGGTLEKHGDHEIDVYAYLYWYECVGAGTSGNTEDASGFSTTLNDEFTDGTVTWKCIGNPSWYSDMKGICRRVWGFNPKIQIIWMIPIKTKYDMSTNTENWQKHDKFDAIRQFCEAYSIRIIDFQKEFPLNPYTKDYIMYDDIHPNRNGYKIMCEIVRSYID